MQSAKPRARYLDADYRMRMCLPKWFGWYVHCDLYAGWGATLHEALGVWRENMLLGVTFRPKVIE